MLDTGRKTADSLRSARWFAPDDLRSFGHRSRIMQLGYSEADFMASESMYSEVPLGASGNCKDHLICSPC